MGDCGHPLRLGHRSGEVRGSQRVVERAVGHTVGPRECLGSLTLKPSSAEEGSGAEPSSNPASATF